MIYYTIWKTNINSRDKTDLLEDESVFKTRRNAFKRAKSLASRLIYDRGDIILVRRIKLGCDVCTEWEFPATPV